MNTNKNIIKNIEGLLNKSEIVQKLYPNLDVENSSIENMENMYMFGTDLQQSKEIDQIKKNNENNVLIFKNDYNSIVENIDYTECINGKCSKIQYTNEIKPFNKLNKNPNPNINNQKYKKNSLLKSNLDILVFLFYLFFITLYLFYTLIERDSKYLIRILLFSLIYILYKIWFI